jgi:leishmanolysin
VVGIMRFDIADVPTLELNGQFQEVVLHEMGHVLGYGTIWDPGFLNLLSGGGGTDPHFIGPQATAAFNRIGGAGYSAGAKVPVENTGGLGTRDAHWRESVFTNELMTGYINAGFNPLSVVSIASMGDEGYTVNYAAADPFTLPFGEALRAAAGVVLHLGDDIQHIPIRVLDRWGRLVRVVAPR